MKEPTSLHILDALDNLSTIVDATSIDEIEVTDDHLLVPHFGGEEEPTEKDIYWIHAGPDEQTQTAIKQTFTTVSEYLQNFYPKLKETGDTKRLVEGINTIMVLVGEAAKKLDRFGVLFKERVVDLKEYKQLQNFYRNKVIKESFREFAKVTVPKEEEATEEFWEKDLEELLAHEDHVEEIAGVHILNDLDVVKNDHLYELFYLKNEAGYRFYTSDLARKIKIACDFGEFSQEYFGDDPLLQIKNWEDKTLHILAQTILKKVRKSLDLFYKEAMQYKGMVLAATVHNACMALMLAANPRNLIRQFALKPCHLYFLDFVVFLRQAIENPEYQKILSHTLAEKKPFFRTIVTLVRNLAHALFTSEHNEEELQKGLTKLIDHHLAQKGKLFSEQLVEAYNALIKSLVQHPSGPVFKALDVLREIDGRIFDPLLQENFPQASFRIKSGKNEIAVLRMAAPLRQELINFAVVTEEFKTFLRSLGDRSERLLMINFQDRSSWKEHARSVALEELSKHAEFANSLSVITLTKDSDFYNQAGIYHEINDAAEFIKHLIYHLKDENTGYYFPPYFSEELFEFIDGLIPKIHDIVFDRKAELSFLMRLDFIELTYNLITLKLCEMMEPTYLAFSSKDGLDLSGTAGIELITLLRGPKKEWREEELEVIFTLLFGPTLMNRERALHRERFDRLAAYVRLLENKGDVFIQFENYTSWHISGLGS